MHGDPFKTPEVSTLMKQYRGAEFPAMAASNTSLSQMLARREEAKAGTRDGGMGGGASGGSELRNSRECFSQSPSFKASFKDSCALERGKMPVKEVNRALNSTRDHRVVEGVEGAGPDVTAAAASSDMCRGGGGGGGSEGVWGELNHVMQTAHLKG